MTCFLEYEPSTVKVHDLIWVRQPDGWRFRKGAYRKLRLAPERVTTASSGGIHRRASRGAGRDGGARRGPGAARAERSSAPARPDGLRPGQHLGRSEHGEVSIRRGQPEEVDLTIADGGQFAAEQRRRRAVLAGGLVVVDDRDPAAGRQRRVEPVQELVRLLDLVIHVRQEREVDGSLGQSRIGRRAVHERDPGDALAREPSGQAVEVGPRDVLGVDRPAAPRRCASRTV